MNPAAEAATDAGEPLYDADGVARFCIDGRRQPCPIHWPDQAADETQPPLPFDG